MRGLDKKTIDLNNQDDLFEFYNSSAEAFYRGAFVFAKNNDFANKFKSDLLYYIIEFERVIKTSFHADRSLEDIDLKRFKKMFPNLCDGIFKIKRCKDVERLGNILNTFRNINAHSLPSMSDFDIFKEDYSGLKNQPVLNKNIHYLDKNGALTIAGFVFIVVNLGRAQSIKSLTARDEKFGLITKGEVGDDNGEDFVNKISHVDWEIKIRDDNKKTIPGAVLGDLAAKAKTNNKNRFEFQLGNDEAYDMRFNVTFFKDKIEVQRDSLTNVFYPLGYSLKITDKNHFIELANQFPAFIFIDLLYKLNIRDFDQKVYQRITEEKNWKLYSKLMYPKFYCDKNIEILLADRKQADLRINSNVCNSALNAIFMKLEKLIIKFYGIDIKKIHYSKIDNLLKMIDYPRGNVWHIQNLRNLASHGYILGEYNFTNYTYIQYDLVHVVTQLCILLKFFKEKQKDIFNCLSKDISTLFISQLLAVKSKLYIRESNVFIKDYPNATNIDELKKKVLFYESSSYPVSLFRELNKLVGGENRCIKVTVKGLDFDLLLLNCEYGRAYLNTLIRKTHLNIVKDTSDGVFRLVTLG